MVDSPHRPIAAMAEQPTPTNPLARAKERMVAAARQRTPSGTDEGRVPAGQKLTQGFPVLDLGIRPPFDPARWRLTVSGLVGKEVSLSYGQLLALPPTELTADFHCVTRWSKLDVPWRGVALPDLLALAQPDDRWGFLIEHASDGYTTNVPRADLDSQTVLVAYELEGKPLPLEHGGPVRLIIPSLYAWKGAKFLDGLQLSATDEPGYWEVRGYHARGRASLQERFG